MQNIKLNNFQVRINEAEKVDGEFNIMGVAISETTTANGHRFIAEELRPAAKGMIGIPLLKDHVNKVDSIVGKVLNSEFDESEREITFKARVSDKDLINKIKDGILNSVSIGAMVKELEETKEGDLIARGIIIKELSLVAVPADSNATFTKAIWEAYGINHTQKVNENNKKLLEDRKILRVQSEENRLREAQIKKLKEKEFLIWYNERKGRLTKEKELELENKANKAIEEAINNFGINNQITK